ncbi:helix-turn-helix domain-containing protein [Nocardia cerradoensis]|uniref:helix-turn-helix domain-containing protein n=1 Tax=Nocardia cerradoensis TaxID=85688 RepID=UPI0002ED35FC|nr:helix-turn-helix transcriptional regulator [Nocardia cerradoensis]NKY46809.1 helix-turn-helix domain-containing protein [Nocardia cerradoensis]
MADERASLPRRQLGRFVRRQREENTSLTQEAVAKAMQWSHSKYARLERGEPGKVLDRDLVELGKILEIPENQVGAMIELARQVAEKTWYNSFNDLIRANFDVYMRLETDARSMEIWRPDIVPGLFQTADYASALNRIYFPKESEEEHARRIQLKLQRQKILTRKKAPVVVDLVLHESVLHTVVGNHSVTASQLRHLADISTRPNVTVRVLPYSVGFPLGTPVGPFAILDFEASSNGVAEPTVVYVENYTGDMYLEEDADVQRYRRASATIQHTALDAVASRTLLRRAARKDATK